jgi:hypothetical protein
MITMARYIIYKDLKNFFLNEMLNTGKRLREQMHASAFYEKLLMWREVFTLVANGEYPER